MSMRAEIRAAVVMMLDDAITETVTEEIPKLVVVEDLPRVVITLRKEEPIGPTTMGGSQQRAVEVHVTAMVIATRATIQAVMDDLIEKIEDSWQPDVGQPAGVRIYGSGLKEIQDPEYSVSGSLITGACNLVFEVRYAYDPAST